MRTEEDATSAPPSVKNSIEKERGDLANTKVSGEKKKVSPVPSASDAKPATSEIKTEPSAGPTRYGDDVRSSTDSAASTGSSDSGETLTSTSSSSGDSPVRKPRPTGIKKPTPAPTPEPAGPVWKEREDRSTRTHSFADADELRVDFLPPYCMDPAEDENVVLSLWNALSQGDSSISKADYILALRSLGLTEQQVVQQTFGLEETIPSDRFTDTLEKQVRAKFRVDLEGSFATADANQSGDLPWPTVCRLLTRAGLSAATVGKEADVTLVPTAVPGEFNCDVRLTLGSNVKKFSVDLEHFNVSVNGLNVNMGSSSVTLNSSVRAEQLGQSLKIANFIASLCRDCVLEEGVLDYRHIVKSLCMLPEDNFLAAKPHLLGHRFVATNIKPLEKLQTLRAAQETKPTTFDKSFLQETYTNRTMRRAYLAPEADKSGTAFLAAHAPPQAADGKKADAPPVPAAQSTHVAWHVRIEGMALPVDIAKSLPENIKKGKRCLMVSLITAKNKLLPPAKLEIDNKSRQWKLAGEPDLYLRGSPDDILYVEFCFEPFVEEVVESAPNTARGSDQSKKAVPVKPKAEVYCCAFATATLRDMEEGRSHMWINGGNFWKHKKSKETTTKSCLCITGPPPSCLVINTDTAFPKDFRFNVFAPRFLFSTRHLHVVTLLRSAAFQACNTERNAQLALNSARIQQAFGVVEIPELFEKVVARWEKKGKERSSSGETEEDRLLSLAAELFAVYRLTGSVEKVEKILEGARVQDSDLPAVNATH